MKHLRFDMIDAFNHGEIRHAQEVMKSLGITYQHATPQSIADQWWFWNCENLPENLPSFLEELRVNPLECVGFGLDEPIAKAILEFENERR